MEPTSTPHLALATTAAGHATPATDLVLTNANPAPEDSLTNSLTQQVEAKVSPAPTELAITANSLMMKTKSVKIVTTTAEHAQEEGLTTAALATLDTI